jgi:hypothetical protein
MDRQVDRPQDEFSEDLNPQPQAGYNFGQEGPDTTQGTPASEMKHMYTQLPNLSDAELAELSVVETGMRLEQGKTYIDLNDLKRGEFSAMASMVAEDTNHLVAKDAVSYDLWNKLRGHEERSNQ